MERALLRTACLVLWAGLLNAPQLLADEAEERYAVAAGHYAEQRWEMAAEHFEKFLEQHRGHVREGHATFFLAEALLQMDRHEDAAARFRDMLERFPGAKFSKQALFRAGEAAYLSGKVAAAGKDLAAFVEQYPTDPLSAYALTYLGEMALSQQDASAAQQHFANCLRRFPEGPLLEDCQLGLALALEKQHRRTEAERLFRQVAERPESPLADRALLHLGLMHYRAGKHDSALAIWRGFESRFPESQLRQRVHLGRGWALYRLQRYGEAAETLASLTKDPEVGIEAQYWLGLSQRALEQWRQAAETLLSAIGSEQEHPLVPAIRFHAGDSLLQLADREGARRQFDLVLDNWPESDWADDALFGKLQATFDNEQFELASKLALQYREQFPASPLVGETYLFRASALQALQNYQQAATEFQSYLEHNPDTPQSAAARAELVICYIRLKNLNQAREAYDGLVERGGDQMVILATTHHLAEAAYESGNDDLAIDLFERMSEDGNPKQYVAKGISGLAWAKLNDNQLTRAAELFEKILTDHGHNPLAPEAALTRGQIFEEQGRGDAALSMYHKVIHDYPDSDEVPEALHRAARIHDRQQQDQQAATLYERLVTAYPEFPGRDAGLYGWAWVLYEMGHAEEAHELFQRLHDEYSQSEYWGDATYRLAKRASEVEQFDRAAGLLEQVVETNTEDEILAHALYLKGRLAARRELWEDVDRPMQRLIDEFPHSALRLPAQYSIAEAAYRRQEYDKAEELFAKLMPQIAGRSESWLAMIPLRRAQLLAQREHWEAALEQAREIREEFPDFARQYEVDYLIGRALAAQGKFDQARRAYREVIHSSQGSKTETAAMAQWMIGESYFHQKQYEQARNEFLRTEILYAYPRWQAGALLQAGKCHELLTEWRQAAELYVRLLQKYPETTFTEEATRRLRVAEQRAASTR